MLKEVWLYIYIFTYNSDISSILVCQTSCCSSSLITPISFRQVKWEVEVEVEVGGGKANLSGAFREIRIAINHRQEKMLDTS